MNDLIVLALMCVAAAIALMVCAQVTAWLLLIFLPAAFRRLARHIRFGRVK